MEGFVQTKNGLFLKNDVIAPVGALRLILRDAKTGRIKAIDDYKNMFVTNGKGQLANVLIGNVANGAGQISYCEVGTDATAPALTDTRLNAPVARKLIAVRSVAAAIATFQTFFTTADGNGSLREAGLYGEQATSQLLSGILFARAAINRTKSINDTLTISWTISFL